MDTKNEMSKGQISLDINIILTTFTHSAMFIILKSGDYNCNKAYSYDEREFIDVSCFENLQQKY